MKSLYCGFLGLCFLLLFQDVKADLLKVYPSNWWVGMKMNRIELLIRNTGATMEVKNVSVSYPGIRILRFFQPENKKYLLVELELSAKTQPGSVVFNIQGAGTKYVVNWLLKKRRPGNGTNYARGVGPEDVINLVIPDRFANGDLANDRIPGLRDQSLNRDSCYHRHGGDLKGILQHLDYFESLGVTALWLLPVQLNDMPNRTEHGYAITDHYTIDPRVGGADAYKELGDSLRKRKMKLVMDAVYNHMGLSHFLVQDPPAADWVHQWPEFTQTNNREQALFDPYAAPSDKKKMTDGWFVPEMPDINHSNSHMAAYLIQNLVWYVEEFGVDAIRVDTYMYNDPIFSNYCNKVLKEEFPAISLFGETKVNGVLNQAYFNQNNLDVGFKSNMMASVDFQCLYNGILPALTEPVGWASGVYKLYNTLSQDFVTRNPMLNVLLLDSHDEHRFFSQVGEDVRKQAIAYLWLLTCRGIPQLYYGSEVLMKGRMEPDGMVRLDFPGGFPGDAKNAFTGAGLSTDEKYIQTLVQKMGKYRKTSSAISKGKLMHWVPYGGLYAYSRYDRDQTILCIMNTSELAQVVDFSRYSERTDGFSTALDIISGESTSLARAAKIPPMTMWVLELSK